MYDVGTVGAAVRLDGSQFFSTLNQMGGRSESVMAQMQATFTRVLGTYGAYRLFKEATNAANDFQQTLANIKSIAPDMDIFGKFGDEITKMDRLYGTMNDTASAAYWAYSSNIRGTVEQLAEFSRQTAVTARVIDADQVPTMDAATTVMNAYKLSINDAARVSDWFFTITAEGKATGPELANSLGMVASTAAIAKVPMEELGAAISVLSRTQPASQAITNLGQVISAFLDPGKEAQKVAKDLGIDLSASAIASKGLAGAIADVNAKAGDNVEALTMMFGNVRAFRGIAVLGGDQYTEFQNTITKFANNSGAAMQAFATRTATSGQKWTTALGDANQTLIKLGQTIRPVTDTLAGAISVTSKFAQILMDNKVVVVGSAVGMALLAAKAAGFFKEVAAMPGAINSMSAALTGNKAAIYSETAGLEASNTTMAANLMLRKQLSMQNMQNISAGLKAAPQNFGTGMLAMGNSYGSRAMPSWGDAAKSGSALATVESGFAKVFGTVGRAIPALTAAYIAGDLLVGVIDSNADSIGKWILKMGGNDIDARNKKIDAQEKELNGKREETYFKRVDQLKKEHALTEAQVNAFANFNEKNFAEVAELFRNGKEPKAKDNSAAAQIAAIKAEFETGQRNYEQFKKQDALELNKAGAKAFAGDNKIDPAEQEKLNELEIRQTEERAAHQKTLMDKGSADAEANYWKEQENLRKLYDEKRNIVKDAVAYETEQFMKGTHDRINDLRTSWTLSGAGKIGGAQEYQLANLDVAGQRESIANLKAKIAAEENQASGSINKEKLDLLKAQLNKEVDLYRQYVKQRDDLDPAKQLAGQRQKYIKGIIDDSGYSANRENIMSAANDAEKKYYDDTVKDYKSRGASDSDAKGSALSLLVEKMGKNDTKTLADLDNVKGNVQELVLYMKTIADQKKDTGGVTLGGE